MARWGCLTVQTLAVAFLINGCSDEAGEGGEHDGESEHGGDGEHDHGNSNAESKGMSTGAECPSDNAPTYESFGKEFMETYCVSCHSTALKGDARKGAPDGHDFDLLAGIVPTAEHIDQAAASGPLATNQLMPPVDPKPTADERRKLGQWLACEAKP